MDISFVLRKFRKSISGFTILALLATFVSFGTASASTFPDTDGHWSEAYVEALYAAGVVSGNDDGTFNPDGYLNRAELSKMLVLGYTVDGVDEDAPAVYADVAESDWYYSYANTAYQEGIMTGEGDGSFNGAAYVNRATLVQAVYNAAGLTMEDWESPFDDVMESDWYHDAVVAAYGWSIVDGESASTFNPGGYATRGAAAKVIYNGWYPVERDDSSEEEEEVEEEEEEVEEETTSEGTLMVSLASDTPDAATVPSGATSVELFAVELTAEDDDVNVDNVTFNHYGVSSLPSDHSVYAYAEVDGMNMRLSSGQSVNSTSHDVTFNNLDLEVEEDETVRLSIRMDVGTVSSTKEVGFQIESADSIDADGADVSGSFPVEGELFSLATDAAGTITVEKNGSVDNPQVGEDDVEIAKFKLTAATEAANLEELGLYVSGTINLDDMAEFELYVSGEDEPLATAEGADSLDVVRFVIPDGYAIAKGGTKSFIVKADLNTGRTSDTINVYIDEDTDILATGDLYGFGMGVTRSDYDGASCTSALSYADCTNSTLEGGDVTISSNGPAATDIAINGNDVTLMNFDIASVTDVTFKNLPITLLVTDNGGNTSGLLNGTTSNITDIKIVDTETGEEVFSSVDANVMTTAVGGGGSTIADTTTDNATAHHLYTDDLEMEAGEELSLALMVDVENQSALSGDTITASLNLGSSYPELRDVNNKVLTNSSVLVPASTITGKTHTLSSPSLTVSLASTPVSETYVKGSQDVEFVGFVFACGDASDCRVTDLTVSGHLDENNDATFETAGSSPALNSFVGSIHVVDSEGNVVSGPESVNGTTWATSFNDIDWTLDAGQTEILYVVGDISNDAFEGGEGEGLAFSLTASSGLTVEDEDGNTFTASGTANTSQSIKMTTSDGGVLTVSTDSSTPREDILLTGATGQEVATYRLAASDEDFVLDKLTVTNRDSSVPGDWDNNVNRVGLMYEDSEGESQTAYAYLSDGTAEFSGLDIFVPRDDNTTITLMVDLNEASSGATPGTEFVDLGIGFDTFEATSSASGETYDASKMNDSDADGSIADSLLRVRASGSTSFDDSDFVNTVVYHLGADNDGTDTLGGSTTFEVGTSADGDPVDFPVGTLLCVDDAANGCSSADDDIYVITALSDATGAEGGDVVTATLISANNDGAYDDDDVVYYAISGEDYLTDSNQMWLYTAQPVFALDSSSPTTGTFAAGETVMIFSVSNSASAEDSVLIRQESGTLRHAADATTNWSAVGTSAVSTSTTVRAEGSASVTVTEDAASATTDYLVYDTGATSVGLQNYGAVSFWVRSDAAKASGDLRFVMDNASDLTAGDDEDLAVGALTAQTWSYQTLSCSAGACGDSSTRYLGLHIAANPDNSNALYVDGIRFHAASDVNDYVEFNLSSDASMDTTASDIRAQLKNNGSVVAEAGINFSSSSAATVRFFPYADGGYTDIEIEEGGSKTFSLVLEADEIITDQPGTDDRLTPYIVLGTASGGSVSSAGGFVWASDTGAESYVQATWVGQVSDTNFSGNTLEY